MKNTFTYVALAMLVLISGCKKRTEPAPEPKASTYTVTFNVDGGSAINAQTVEANKKAQKPADPTKAGYAFIDWYTDAKGTTVFNFDTPINANTTVYAIWKPTSSETAFNDFITKGRFMPNDPRQMTADDKAWFAENGAFDFTYVIKPLNFTLTAAQENQIKIYTEGVLKTLNYIVYTKPFALATNAMFKDRAFYYDKTNTVDPDPLPSVVGTILRMRGLNTSVLKSKVFNIELEKRAGSYIGTVNNIVFNPSRDNYTTADFTAGRRLDHKLPADNAYDARITIPVGENFETLKPYEDFWMYDSQKLNDIYNTDPNHSFSRGFNFDLFVHEMLHSLLHWNHANGGHETDLVYSYSGMIGMLMEMRSEERYILTTSKTIPSSLTDVDVMHNELTQEFGGHMPMACYNKSPFSFGFRRGTYNLYSMYMQNQLGVQVYNPPLPAGTIFLKYTTGPNAGDPKAIPANPYSGITWKIKYNGVQ